MTIRITDPVTAYVEGLDDPTQRKLLRQHLTYHDKKVDFELRKAKNSRWLMEKLGPEAFAEHIEALKKERYKTLLFDSPEGEWTYTGLVPRLERALSQEVLDLRRYPEHALIPWAKVPDKKPRPYQEEAVHALLSAKHAGVEIGTGLGKSFIIQLLIKEIGRQTVIMAPGKSIARQLHKELEVHFGKKNVGLYGDGKKDYKKLITVAIAASLAKIPEGSPAWEKLSQAEVFIPDESHLTPAQTLRKVCFGLMRNAPYRFFFSGTQMRGDGLDLVLEGITGPIVYRMTVREGVDQGYLARPLFTMVHCRSDSDFTSKDANEETRAHLYYNPLVNARAADIANKSVRLLKRPTLILVEEVEQFMMLLPHLRHKVAFAHGPLDKKQKEKLPSQYWDSDPNGLVDRFNSGEIELLVGTSCVSTGTDIRATEHILWLMGQKSEVKVKQGVGRGTRLFGSKKDCLFTDFDVVNNETTHRHADARRAIYNDIYGPVRELVS